MQHLSVLRLPLHGEPVEGVGDGSGLQGDGADREDLGDVLDLLLDMEQALDLPLDGEGAGVVGDEVVVGAVHVVLPQEVVEAEVEEVLVNVSLQICWNDIWILHISQCK